MPILRTLNILCTLPL